MHWIVTFFGSSVGKKILMALTGFCFIGFLTGHLIGNLTLYGGRDAFNAYAEHLHALGPVITAVELGLLTLAVGLGLTLRTWAAFGTVVLIVVLQLVTAPVSAHLVGRAAYRSGQFRRDLARHDELAEGLDATGFTAADVAVADPREVARETDVD